MQRAAAALAGHSCAGVDGEPGMTSAADESSEECKRLHGTAVIKFSSMLWLRHMHVISAGLLLTVGQLRLRTDALL